MYKTLPEAAVYIMEKHSRPGANINVSRKSSQGVVALLVRVDLSSLPHVPNLPCDSCC